MSSRGKFKPLSGAGLIRRLSLDQLRDTLFRVGKWRPADVYETTHNRQSRRLLARAMRKHGRGYTKPMHGPAHTRGGM